MYEPNERDALDEHVDVVIGVLQEMPLPLVHAIGAALALTGSSYLWSRTPLAYLGSTLEHCWNPESDGFLFRTRLRLWLGVHARSDQLLERLEAAESPPWPAIRRALMACREIPV
jgi:hypothetical protein